MKDFKIKPLIYKNCNWQHLDTENILKWIEEHHEEQEVKSNQVPIIIHESLSIPGFIDLLFLAEEDRP